MTFKPPLGPMPIFVSDALDWRGLTPDLPILAAFMRQHNERVIDAVDTLLKQGVAPHCIDIRTTPQRDPSNGMGFVLDTCVSKRGQ